MIELRWLRSFLAVADEMHLSRAARKLHLAQPALTTQIQQLERFLGSSLFQRSNRISGLTAAGLVLLPDTRDCGTCTRVARNRGKSSKWGNRTFAARSYSASRDQPTRGMFENPIFGIARQGPDGT